MASRSLLLVDDEPHLGLIVGRLARRISLETTCTPDVASAWQTLSRRPYDLVLLDVNLPGASGIDLLRRLRAPPGPGDQAGARPRQQVALFCQPAQTGDVAAGWAAGADYLVAKDLVAQPEAWQSRVQEILAHVDGQPPAGLLAFLTNASRQSTCDLEALEQVLQRREAHILGREVLEQVLRRALERAFGSIGTVQERAAWVVAGEGRLNRMALPRSVPRAAWQLFIASVADQWWCLLGSVAGTPLLEALQIAHLKG